MRTSKTTEGAAASPPLATRWGLVFLGIAAGVCVAFQIGKVPPALTDLRATLGLSLFVGGWVISIFNAVGAVCGIALGAAGDRFGYRRSIVLGLVLAGAGSLAGAAAPGPAWLLATRTLEGVGYLLVVIAAPALIFKVTRPRDLGLAFGAWSCFMPVGTSSMMLLVPPLIASVGWRGVWLLNGGLLLVLSVLFRRLTRNVSGSGLGRAEPPALWRNLRLVASRPGPVLLAVAWGTYTMTFIVLMGFLPTLLLEHGYHRPAAAALTAFAVAVNVVGALGGGALIRHGVPRWRLMAFAGMVTGLSMLGIYNPKLPDVVRYGLCVLFSAVGGFVPVSVLGGAPLYAPRPNLVATTNGFVNQCSYVAMMVGPPAAAALATARDGWQDTPWILTSAAALAILCALLLRKVPTTHE